MVTKYLRPRSADEALALFRQEENAFPLSGGTYLLTSQFADVPMTVLSVCALLSKDIEDRDGIVTIGAGATFQDIVDAPQAPAALKAAALGMADRNIRNRATAGGNVGANKSCASLVPLFLVADARYRRLGAAAIGAEQWQKLASPKEKGIIAAIELAMPKGRLFGYGKYSRTTCDIAVLTCAVSAELSGDRALRRVRIAMGGLSPHARRYPELEALFEGKAVPEKSDIEAMVRPVVRPIDDLRGGADFKRLRAAALLADVMHSLEARP